MNAKTERKPLVERLKAGLREGIAYAQGKMDLRTIQLPDRPPKFSAKKVIRIERTVRSRAILSLRRSIRSPSPGQRPAERLPERTAFRSNGPTVLLEARRTVGPWAGCNSSFDPLPRALPWAGRTLGRWPNNS
jgi:hypothetical protein